VTVGTTYSPGHLSGANDRHALSVSTDSPAENDVTFLLASVAPTAIES
jgi:hypothetical protein